MKVTRQLDIEIPTIPLRLKEAGKSKANVPIEDLSDGELGRVAEEWGVKLIERAKTLRSQGGK